MKIPSAVQKVNKTKILEHFIMLCYYYLMVFHKFIVTVDINNDC